MDKTSKYLGIGALGVAAIYGISKLNEKPSKRDTLKDFRAGLADRASAFKQPSCGLADPFIVDKSQKINEVLRSLGADFYQVCSRLKEKDDSGRYRITWRKWGNQCLNREEFPNSAYISEKQVAKRLEKLYGITLDELNESPAKAQTKAENFLEKNGKTIKELKPVKSESEGESERVEIPEVIEEPKKAEPEFDFLENPESSPKIEPQKVEVRKIEPIVRKVVKEEIKKVKISEPKKISPKKNSDKLAKLISKEDKDDFEMLDKLLKLGK